MILIVRLRHDPAGRFLVAGDPALPFDGWIDAWGPVWQSERQGFFDDPRAEPEQAWKVRGEEVIAHRPLDDRERHAIWSNLGSPLSERRKRWARENGEEA